MDNEFEPVRTKHDHYIFSSKNLPQSRIHFLILGLLFLVTFWLFGYDGITFSDEVTYLQLGQRLWDNNAVVSDYHFSSRWGAFLFSGFFTHLLGYSDRYAGLATLGFYLATLFVLWKVTPAHLRRWSVLFFVGHVYLLHFLTKVYPDGFLILWVVLVPATAAYREKYPVLAASAIVTALFIGFCTKETMVFLFPLPLILFWNDFKRKRSLSFYPIFLGLSLLVAVLYLSFYQWQFGDWLYRFKSVNEGHYISEYTYHDKGLGSILKRLTYLPLLTFIDRTYWLWLVMAVPGIYYGIKNGDKIGLEYGFSTVILMTGFWFMSSTLEFYNPLYLNPRHLIILIAPLSVNIAWGARYWLNSLRWKRALATLLVLGAIYSLVSGETKIGAFYLLFAAILFIKDEKIQYSAMVLSLVLPVIFSVYYQHQQKNYPHFLQAFQTEVNRTTDASPLLTHEFVVHSKDVLLHQPQSGAPVVSILSLDSLQLNPPESLTLLVYQYYRHAYPAEQEYLDQALEWLHAKYKLDSEKEDPWLTIERYRRKP